MRQPVLMSCTLALTVLQGCGALPRAAAPQSSPGTAGANVAAAFPVPVVSPPDSNGQDQNTASLPPPVFNCDNADSPVCDGFETIANAAQPDPNRWNNRVAQPPPDDATANQTDGHLFAHELPPPEAYAVLGRTPGEECCPVYAMLALCLRMGGCGTVFDGPRLPINQIYELGRGPLWGWRVGYRTEAQLHGALLRKRRIASAAHREAATDVVRFRLDDLYLHRSLCHGLRSAGAIVQDAVKGSGVMRLRLHGVVAGAHEAGGRLAAVGYARAVRPQGEAGMGVLRALSEARTEVGGIGQQDVHHRDLTGVAPVESVPGVG